MPASEWGFFIYCEIQKHMIMKFAKYYLQQYEWTVITSQISISVKKCDSFTIALELLNACMLFREVA